MNELNKQQKKVLLNSDESLVVIAGPGSGKTKTTISTIKYKVEQSNINIIKNMLVLTFSNNAALEIKERALSSFEANLSGLYFGTFHSIFKRLLVEGFAYKNMGMSINPTIVIPNENKRHGFLFLNEVIDKDLTEDEKEFIINGYYKRRKKALPKKLKINRTILKDSVINMDYLLNKYERIINKTTKNDLNNISNLNELYLSINNKVIEGVKQSLLKNKSDVLGEELFNLYIEGKVSIKRILKIISLVLNSMSVQKVNQSYVTFTDILLLSLFALDKNKEFRKSLNKHFKHIFVDEYQDTNIIEVEILSLILGLDSTICVIGDGYQSIYKFLGADITNILTAKNKFNAKVIQLVENYRSSDNIVNLTNHLGSNMIEKIDGWIPCKSSNKKVKNEPIKIVREVDTESDFSGIYTYISKQIKKSSIDRKIGIIARTGKMNVLEKHFIRNKIAYKKFGGITMLEAQEVMLLLRLFQWAIEEKTYLLNDILLNIEGLGEVTINKYINSLKDEKAKKPTGKIIKIVEELNQIKTIKEVDLELFKTELFKFFEEKMFYKISSKYEKDRLEEAFERIDIIKKELIDVDIDEIRDILDEYILGGKEQKSDDVRISITTIHSAKGLEYDDVYFLSGSEEDYKRDDEEEAQRLFYVAISRAKENLYIFSSTDSIFNINEKYINNNKEIFKELKFKPRLTFGKFKGCSLEDLKKGTFEQKNYIKYLYDLYQDAIINNNVGDFENKIKSFLEIK